MEKIIKIDGKDVVFKSVGNTKRRYKMQFGREMLRDILKLMPKSGVDLTKMTEEESAEWFADNVDTEMLEDIIWVFAKSGDTSIPPVFEWLGQFEEFPIMDIFVEIQELFLSTLSTGKK